MFFLMLSRARKGITSIGIKSNSVDNFCIKSLKKCRNYVDHFCIKSLKKCRKSVDNFCFKTWVNIVKRSISPNYFCQAKSWRRTLFVEKNCHSISPTIKTLNFNLKLEHFLPNCHLIKKCFNSACTKKSGANVGEIDPRGYS